MPLGPVTSPDFDDTVMSSLRSRKEAFDRGDPSALQYFQKEFHHHFAEPIQVVLQYIDDFSFVHGYIRWALLTDLQVTIAKRKTWHLEFNRTFDPVVVIKQLCEAIKEVQTLHRQNSSYSRLLLNSLGQALLKKALILFRSDPPGLLSPIQSLFSVAKPTRRIYLKATESECRDLVVPLLVNLLNKSGPKKFGEQFEKAHASGKALREAFFNMAGYISPQDFTMIHDVTGIRVTYVEFKEALFKGNIELVDWFLEQGYPLYISSHAELVALFKFFLRSDLPNRQFRALHENIQKASKGRKYSVGRFILELAMSKNRADIVNTIVAHYLDDRDIAKLKDDVEYERNPKQLDYFGRSGLLRALSKK